MFVIHGQSGSFSAIVGTSDAHKAVLHLRRMSQSGLSVVIKDSRGRLCNPSVLLLERPGAASSASDSYGPH